MSQTLIDTAEIRKVMGHFPTGVVVITAAHEGAHIGMTLQSFVSLSLEPPLIMLSVARTSKTWPIIAASGRFVVNILSVDQGGLARQFARSGSDKFLGVALASHTPAGGPALSDTVGFIDCVIETEYDGGDHIIVVARVTDLMLHGATDDEFAEALAFYRSGFASLSCELTSHAPTHAPHSPTIKGES